jgi:uncharacterized protein (TIGR02600 family)
MNFPDARWKTKRSFSLVLVLLVLALISILIISFFSGVSSDLSSTTAYANGNGTRELADNVVQLMEAQIKGATTAPVDSTGAVHTFSNGLPFSWASQPGMIRTYTAGGTGLMFYKLYSSDNMRTVWNNSTAYAAAMTDDLSTMDMQDPSKFTDLNSPVTATINGASTTVYPIVDPIALNSDKVAGFSVNSATSPNNVAGVTYNPGSSLPMPVRWLYKLQNGALVAAPTGGTTGTVNLSTLGANAANPIVGRVAFWTDDESSKVNINTAGEGTYWDTPRFCAMQETTTVPNPALTTATFTTSYPYPEYALAASQPVQYEFQRYPGHPAQVALSPIFSNLTVQYSTPASLAAAMAGITPFLAPGGSEAGTLTITQAANLNAAGVLNLAGATRKSLYATVDEFLYGTGAPTAAPKRPYTDTSQVAVTPSWVQASKFFITANSRSPELNLFGMPRIACWPISSTLNLANNPSTNQYTSVFDRMIAFCSSLNSGTSSTPSYAPYYFQRLEPNDTSYDYANITRNQQLYSYLQNLTSQPVPGFSSGNSATILGKYPGNGTASDRDQILTEIFDYIRCTDLCDPFLYNNLSTRSDTYAVTFPATGSGNNTMYPVTPIQIGKTMGFGTAPIIDQVGICLISVFDGNRLDYGKTITTGSTNTAATVSAPYVNTGTLGTYNVANETPAPNYATIMAAAGMSTNAPLSTTQQILQAAVVMQAYQPTFGNPGTCPVMYLNMKGLNSITFTGAGCNNPNPFSAEINNMNLCVQNANSPVQGPIFGPTTFATGEGQIGTSIATYMNPTTTFAYTSPTVPSGTVNYYPGVSLPFVVDSSKGTSLTVGSPSTTSTGPITISMLAANTTGGRINTPSVPVTGNAYQTLNFGFPTNTATPATNGAMVMPLPSMEVSEDPTNAPSTGSYAWGFQHRIVGDNPNYGTFSAFQPYPTPNTNAVFVGDSSIWGHDDCVKSFFLVNHGDSRLIAASANPALNPTCIRSYLTSTSDSPSASYTSPLCQFSHYFNSKFQKQEYYNPLATGNANAVPAANQPNPATLTYIDLSTTYLPNLTVGSLTSSPAVQTYYGSQYPEDSQRPIVPMAPWSGWPTSSPGSPNEANVYENGDFDNNIAWWIDGPSINRPDEGDSGGAGNYLPYFSDHNTYRSDTAALGATYFTPNRIMPSPGMFGSLPTGVMSNIPWQTLLFRPQPVVSGSAANYYAHTEAAVPAYSDAGYNAYTTLPDHLFLDLFWMPIVEPYAISDSFSTAGKINMNYQIEPFSYIDRNTSLVCLLKNERIPAVPDTADWYYKGQALGYSLPMTNFRLSINPAESGGTLRQFLARFNAGDIFRSASEICDIFLVPNSTTGATGTFANDAAATSFWATHRLTGDNSRERPYTNLYERLTTKSNTFTIHMRVQSLKQSPASRAAGIWVEGADTIEGEYRGSSLIERYLDPNSTPPDYATNTATPGTAGNLDSNYKFRIVRTTQFVP